MNPFIHSSAYYLGPEYGSLIQRTDFYCRHSPWKSVDFIDSSTNSDISTETMNTGFEGSWYDYDKHALTKHDKRAIQLEIKNTDKEKLLFDSDNQEDELYGGYIYFNTPEDIIL